MERELKSGDRVRLSLVGKSALGHYGPDRAMLAGTITARVGAFLAKVEWDDDPETRLVVLDYLELIEPAIEPSPGP